MKLKIQTALQNYYRTQIGFLSVVMLIRIFEYFSIASKSFAVKYPLPYELSGLFYDIWIWLFYSMILLIPVGLIFLLHKKTAGIVNHTINIIALLFYISFILVFSQRTKPYDHEFFTRDISESIQTIKQFATIGFKVYLPYIVYILLYVIIIRIFLKKLNIKPLITYIILALSHVSVILIKYASPDEKWFSEKQAYYLVCNKMTYWGAESYKYFKYSDRFTLYGTDPQEIDRQIAFYWKNHPAEYISKEYPLMHRNTSPDVLGNFFSFHKKLPNIVILVIEGLARNFSGDSAVYGSYTPFLDSLSKRSLYWINQLSAAPGTFAVHPSITGSLPYATRGFSLMSEMPDHLSLIKILRRNGYFTSFMAGSSLDFDNMGGYIRVQGTDFLLSKFGSKYKEMGIGPKGWGMGYPDDALYRRSMEALDSIKKFPYLNIYHTVTSHEPYLFEQQPIYEKRFDIKLKNMHVSDAVKKTMQECKNVMTTFMFADDCLKKFFSDYKKRPEYSNTIFIITGDHHIGSVPSTEEIDDYHVPLIIYSPMLKTARKFYSVNTHNNIAPTLLAMLNANFHLEYNPPEVHWINDVMDTAVNFRNIHKMAFMAWGRDIPDYIYKNYYLYEDMLYELSPELKETQIINDSLLNYITELRENFKFINSYVCMNNKVFPKEKNILPGEKELLLEINNPEEKAYNIKEDRAGLINFFRVPRNYRYLYVDVALDFYIAYDDTDKFPAVQLALIDTTRGNRDYQYSSNKDVMLMAKKGFAVNSWSHLTTYDMFTLSDYSKYKNLVFDLAFYNNFDFIDAKKKNLEVKIYGIK
ncbi:MAG: LTA synthase family protein [Bacteroidia bacterium]|nr:LTA synthase family protein [Bacteroidia bacterium]